MLRFAPRRFRIAPLLVTALLISATLSVVPAARAWNATGHMTITAIAESRLSDAAKKNVLRLVPLVDDVRTPDFITSSVWMDDIRADGVRLYDRWHISNHAHSPDGTAFPEAPHADDVAWAVAENIKVLKSEKASDGEKARSLRFLIHTVEDAHNPLHSGTRYTKEIADGDRGGNRFTLENVPGVPTARNLHSLWDGALGTFKRGEGPLTANEEQARALAVTLTTRYPESSLPESSVLNPQQWMEEGTALLKTVVYPATATPDAAYMETGRPIAEKRAVLAGYRLAKILNAIWATPTVSTPPSAETTPPPASK